MVGNVPKPQGSPREEKDLRSLVLEEVLQLLRKGEQAKVTYARSLGYDIEIKLIPTDPSLTTLTAVLSSEPLATEPTPQTAR